MMSPVALTTSRIRLLFASGMNRSPEPSTATELAPFSSAEVARPLSPPKPNVPLPATVMMSPVALTTSRIRAPGASAKNRSPAASTERPRGLSISAAVASPWSPVEPAVPLPATVMMSPVAATSSRIRLLFASAMNRSPAASRAMLLGAFSSAAVASPLSPVKPAVPLPATVMMSPVAFTNSRIRLFWMSSMKTSPAGSRARPHGPFSSAEVATPLSPL